jgi:hypothetical protein
MSKKKNRMKKKKKKKKRKTRKTRKNTNGMEEKRLRGSILSVHKDLDYLVD